jgi:Arylsulfotransferase (ASST)
MLSMRGLILGPALALAFGAGAASTHAQSAVPQQAAPTCTPASLDNSALQDRTVTISPLPGSRDAAPQTQISFLGAPAGQLRVLSVLGSRSGAHGGRLEAYSQGDGASFLPARPFAEGERVTVRAMLGRGRSAKLLLDRFAIATEDPLSSTPEADHPGAASEIQHFHSRPELQPPLVTVTTQSPDVAGGDELLTPSAGPGQAGPMILDPSGGLVWFKALPPHTSATNLQVQEYGGQPVLTWWQGDISEHGFGLGEDVIADRSYTDIAHVQAGNGHRADLHEFQLTPQGTALITAYYPILCNLSAVDGPAHGALTDAVFQEIDVSTGLVMYEWTSVDHVAVGESEERAATSSTSWPFDFFHINSIGLDQDGSLLVSARNTWTVYDVDPRSGQILWRLGGRRSSFKLAPGAASAFQHDPRELPDGAISEFDNGASPKVHDQSRAVVLSLDRQDATATLASQFTHTPPLLSESQGSVQALANGDWFVGWGQEPYFSEFGPEGQLLFDAHLPAHDRSYRAYRFPWTGMPAHPPAFAFQPGGQGAGTVYASWNGATLVSAWRVLAGRTPTTLVPVAQVARSGFETAIAVPQGTVGPDVTVQALDASGGVLGTAPTAAERSL